MAKLIEQKDFLKTDLTGKTVVFTGGTDGMGKVWKKRDLLTPLGQFGLTRQIAWWPEV